jgi:hypothetical protein
MTKRKKERTWSARVLRIIVVLAVGLPLLFLAAANVFLSFVGLAPLFAATNTISAKYRRAWMVWPGTVHVRDLRITFQDKNLEWSLDFERASVSLSLTEVAKRTFHAHWVRAEGGSFRMRHRIDPASKNEPWVATALPKIPEFPSPAVFEATVPEPPISDEKYNLWTVHLEDVDAQVHEIWVQFVRYTGSGRARGAFELRPARRLWVGPATLELSPGQLKVGAAELAARLEGTIRCVVDPFDVRVPVGREVLRYINTDLRLRNTAFQLGPLTQFFKELDGKRIGVQPGQLDIKLLLRRGFIQPGSEIAFSSPGASIDLERLQTAFDGLRVTSRMGQAKIGETTLELVEARLKPPGEIPAIRISGATGKLTSKGDDSAGELELTGKRVELRAFSVPDARAVNALLPASSVGFLAGKIEGALRASQEDEQRSGKLDVEANALAVRVGEDVFSGAASVEAHFSTRSARTLDGDAALHAKLPRLRISSADKSHTEFRSLALDAVASSGGGPRFQGHLELGAERAELVGSSSKLSVKPELKLVVADFDGARLDGKVDATLRVDSAATSHADESGQCSTLDIGKLRLQLASKLTNGKADGRLWAWLDGAALTWGDFRAKADARAYATLNRVGVRDGGGNITLGLDVLDVSAQSGADGSSGWQIRAPKINAQLAAWVGHGLVGWANVTASSLDGRIGGTKVRSDLLARIPAFSASLDDHSAHFSGHVALQRTAVETEDRAVKDWWAELDVRSGALTAKRNLDLSALFSAKLRDATPGVEILNAGDALPGWLAGLIPSQSLTAEGMIKRRCRVTEISLTHAADGPLSVHGRLQSDSEAVRGAFLVQLTSADLLSAGVAFDPNDTNVSVFAGDGWFRRQSAELDSSARTAFTKPCSTASKTCGAD